MSTFYPDYIRYGFTSLSFFAELLAGNSKAPFFKYSRIQLLSYYPLDSKKLLNANLEDPLASFITLEEARKYCEENDLAVPTKLILSSDPEELKLRVLVLEQEIAKISMSLRSAKSKLPEDEPVSAMRTVGALAMLLANEVKHKFQKDNKPLLEPIGQAIVTMIENDLNKKPQFFASKTMQKTIKQGLLEFHTRLKDNDI
jgi:hypothetical protein